MKTSKISQLLIVFYFITLTGCVVDVWSDTNGDASVEKCWTIIDVNTGVPITFTATLSITYNSHSSFGGHVARYTMGTDHRGKACGSFVGGPPSIISGEAWAPNYFATSFDSIIPDVIKLTPSGDY